MASVTLVDQVKLMLLGGVIQSRAFGTGWFEGHARVRADGAPNIVPGSMFKPGTVEFAASQAAVAFYIGMETR